MIQRVNRQIVLAARPTGGPTAGDFKPGDLAFVEADVPAVKDGEVLVRNLMFSVDPFQRTVMGNAPSETATIEIGEVMRSAVVGIIEETRNPQFSVGDHVNGWLGWQDYAVAGGPGLRKLDADAAPVSTALGVLGHTGLTAWLGVVKLVEPTPGGTFVVTNAAGSVGSLAVQLAKLKGYRVVGIAGGAEKVAYLRDELGVDAAVDYKAETFAADLDRALPEGIDRLLDSVGGSTFEALMPSFNKDAQAVIMGQIALYGRQSTQAEPDRLPDLLNLIQYRKLQLIGLQLPDHFHAYPEFLEGVAPLVANGTIKYREEFVDGFDQLPDSLHKLFEGSNQGKLIVRA